MLKAMAINRYSQGTSTLHRLDPRTKIILTVLFLAMVFFLQRYQSLLVLLLFTVTLSCWAGKPFMHSIKGLRPIVWFALITLFFNACFIGGKPVSDSGFLHYFSHEGVYRSALMFLRLMLLVSGTSLLTFTTSPLSLTAGLEKLMKPLNHIGVSVHEIAMMLALALRFMPVIADEAEKLIKAHASRFATSPSESMWQKATKYLPLIVPLCVGVVKRGDDLATAMEARCYIGGSGRTQMRRLKFSGVDFASAGALLIVATLLMLIEYRPF